MAPRRPASEEIQAKMVSHNRYSTEQKRFFAANLHLGKDRVIGLYREKYSDSSFGYSQYRYLRGEVGRDIEFGAPLLRGRKQGPQTPSKPKKFSQQSSAAAPRASYDKAFALAQPASVPSLLQSNDAAASEAFATVFNGFPGFTNPTANVHTPVMSTYTPRTTTPSSPTPDHTWYTSCGVIGCAIPQGSEHTHLHTGEVVFPSVAAVLTMLQAAQNDAFLNALCEPPDEPSPPAAGPRLEVAPTDSLDMQLDSGAGAPAPADAVLDGIFGIPNPDPDPDFGLGRFMGFPDVLGTFDPVLPTQEAPQRW